MKKLSLLLLGAIISLSVWAQGNASPTPTKLKCDYLVNPLGIDNPNPRLTWMLSGTNSKQSAYRLLVGTDSIAVLNGRANCWDTRMVDSDAMLVTYNGKELLPFTRYYWKVLITGENGGQVSSEVASFETGMMEMKNWQGAWIGDRHDRDFKPAPYFRKTFEAKKTIKSARAYIVAAGLYELYINGEKIGNHRLDPMYTRFDRRNLYVTYDVTTQLENGKNAIGVLLGNGWYNHQSGAVWDFDKAPWRNRPSFCFDLRITYTDGTVEVIPSELDWKTSTSGPLIFNSIYTAEHYDFRLEDKNWATAGFDDSQWHGVSYRPAPSQHVTAQHIEPIRNVEEYKPVSFKKLNDSTYIYDLGQNFSGVTKVKVSGEKGTVVKVRHGERLSPNGYLDMSNIDVYHRPVDDTDPFQTDILILSGNKEDEFMAKFNYKGFRYVEVTSDKPVNWTENSITGYFMHNDVAQKGHIKTSNKLIEKIWHATNYAYLSNMMGILTDCPQREKNGWTGDGHFAIETGLYNFDGITVYEKWHADHQDEQQPNGVLPDIIPTGGWGYGTHNGVDWTSTIAIIPWEIYMFYGDSKLLADCYENIKRYVDYIDRTSPSGLTSWGRGDWVPVKSQSSLELTSSIYFYVDTDILAKAARLFDNEDDYKHYSALAAKIKKAINDKYLDKETGIYASGTQTELSTPLQWGIVPDEYKAKVAANLADKVKAAGFHLDVGVLGTRAILNALSENGYPEVAYKLTTQDTYPSWGWWIKNGATTLLENWDLQAERDISDNHIMFGGVGGWFFKGLAGINYDPAQPGFKHIILRPKFIDGLNDYEASYESPYGTIISKWTRKKKDITYTVNVPANSTATLYLSDDIKGEQVIELKAGNHVLNLRKK